MTSYHGGKQRIGKHLAPVIYNEATYIQDEEGFKIKGYCEPFCGMLGVYQHIPEMFGGELKYKAGDQNKSLIMMWQATQKGWKPPTTKSKKEYEDLRYNKKSSAIKGFIGHVATFRGIYFGHYYTGFTNSKVKYSSKKVSDIGTKLKNVTFSSGLYTQFSNLKNYIIYCDPPYENTAQRYYDDEINMLKFDSDQFWNWCRKMSKNNIVFVSSYNAPKDFEKIWQHNQEKLYIM